MTLCPSPVPNPPRRVRPPSLLPASQSFLGVLQLLQKGNPLALVQSYGELYRSLAADEAPSWGDHLLNEVGAGLGWDVVCG